MVLLASALLATAAIPAEATAFSDVSGSNAYLDAINYVSDNNLMVGTTSTQFSPGTGLTRAMIVSILYRKAGSPAVTTNSTPFTDVPATAYYRKAVIWATNQGIVAGTTATTFSPNQNVTREQASCFFQRFSKKTTTTVTKSGSYTGYADSGSVSNFAKESVGWAIANGLLETPSNKIRPTSHMTRGEAAFALTAFGTNVERILSGKDHFKFRNVSSNFSSTYYMTNNHYTKAKNRVWLKYYTTESKNVYNNAIKELDYWRNSSWKGHCFGMCATSILDKYGKIAFNENYGTGTTSISQIGAKPGTEQESALTYYHLAQHYDNLCGISHDAWTTNTSQEFNNTVKKLQFAKGPALLSYISVNETDEVHHAVIVNSCTWNSTGDRYYWKVYDPNTAQTSQWTITIKDGYYHLPDGTHFLTLHALANYTENGKEINELNKFNYLDIDGYQNLKNYSSGTLSLDEPSMESNTLPEAFATMEDESRDPNTYSTIGFYLQDGLIITNDCGETLERSRENGFTGDMEIYDFRPIIGNGPFRYTWRFPSAKPLQ